MINAELGFDAEVVYDIDLQGKDFDKVNAEYSQLRPAWNGHLQYTNTTQRDWISELAPFCPEFLSLILLDY